MAKKVYSETRSVSAPAYGIIEITASDSTVFAEHTQNGLCQFCATF